MFALWGFSGDVLVEEGLTAGHACGLSLARDLVRPIVSLKAHVVLSDHNTSTAFRLLAGPRFLSTSETMLKALLKHVERMWTHRNKI